MKIWTTTADCPCGKKHSFYTQREEMPSGHYGYRCRSLLIKREAGADVWTESAKAPKSARKVSPAE